MMFDGFYMFLESPSNSLVVLKQQRSNMKQRPGTSFPGIEDTQEWMAGTWSTYQNCTLAHTNATFSEIVDIILPHPNHKGF